MELSYWQSRWRKDNIGFHMPGGYPGLKKYWNRLNLPGNPTVLVPLCGKTEDLIQIENFGAKVVGVEISEKAICEFFEEHNRDYNTDSFADFTIRTSGNIELWQGDFLKFPDHKHASFDLIYDKAAIVALPKDLRKRYADKLLQLSGISSSVLLHHFIYSQKEMNGPPFSVPDEEIKRYFSGSFTISVLEKNSIPAENFPKFQRRGLKSPIKECLLLLTPRLRTYNLSN